MNLQGLMDDAAAPVPSGVHADAPTPAPLVGRSTNAGGPAPAPVAGMQYKYMTFE